MRFAVLALIAVSIIGCGDAKEIITFKGVPLGQPGSYRAVQALCMENRANIEFAELVNEPTPCEKVTNSFYFFVDYGNLVEASADFHFDAKGALHSVKIQNVPKSSILELVQLLETKYTKPKKSVETVKNKLGLDFENATYTWVDPVGNKITVESIYRDVNTGQFVIESAAKLKAQKQLNDGLKEENEANL